MDATTAQAGWSVRRMTGSCALALLSSLTTAGVVTAQSTKPNVVYILVDNWGWGDIRIQGGTVPTPRIDKLAREELRMTNFNVKSQCVPTRSAIMTGRLPIRSGTHRVTYGLPYGMAPWEYTLPELLSDAGYGTAAFGKWHLGDVEGRLPTDQGFDVWFGIKNTTDEAGYSSTPQFDPEVFPQPYIWQGVRGQPSEKVRPFDLQSRKTIDRESVERSEAFIAEQARGAKPFFLYTSLTQIHPPTRPSSGFRQCLARRHLWGHHHGSGLQRGADPGCARGSGRSS